jgi:flagellar biosynthetic protein FliR
LVGYGVNSTPNPPYIEWLKDKGRGQIMSFTDTELIGLVQSWLWPFSRVAGLLMAAPVFGTPSVPVRIRLVLALAIAVVLVPVLPAPPVAEPLSPTGILIVGQQVLIGVTLGLALRVVFLAVDLAGQVVAQQMGLGFSTLVDPQNGSQVPVISQFHSTLATLIFLSLNGHLVLLEALADSFRALPVGTDGLTREGLWEVAGSAGWLFAQAVLIALPAIASLTIINLAFAVMSRVAPQMNLFAVGFPAMLIFGMMALILSLSGFNAHASLLFDGAFEGVQRLFGRP